MWGGGGGEIAHLLLRAYTCVHAYVYYEYIPSSTEGIFQVHEYGLADYHIPMKALQE